MGEQVAPGIILYSRVQCGLPVKPGGDPGAAQRNLRVHHGASKTVSGFNACAAVWRAYRDLHVKTNGWSDIGYSFGVGQGDTPDEAVILTGRGWGQSGAHTLNHNDDLGVVFIGNGGNPEILTPGVKRAFRYLRSARNAGINRPAFGHRDTSATACPGDALYAWVKAGMPPPESTIVVRAGENLRQVAKRTGSTRLDIVRANPALLKRIELLAGEELARP